MSNNSNDPKDGAGRRERAVADGQELRESAVAHARQLGEALGLASPMVSSDAPPAYPAPPVPAPPYPTRSMKETLPATPRAIARQQVESPVPATGEVAPAAQAVDPAKNVEEPG